MVRLEEIPVNQFELFILGFGGRNSSPLAKSDALATTTEFSLQPPPDCPDGACS